MAVEHYSHVMHLVCSVSGTLRAGVGAMDALRATLPAGTLSGAPKVRAMQIIDELEPVKRGGYGGAVGYLSYGGDLDTAIHIRTVVVKDGVAHVQAGGGTVADARPDDEYDESVAKMERRDARDRARVRAARLALSAVGCGSSSRGRHSRRSVGPRAKRRAGVWNIILDNYDSFTYNLVQYLGELGTEVETVHNDRASTDRLLARDYDRCVISPGPCTPNEAGISLEVVRRFPEAGIPTQRAEVNLQQHGDDHQPDENGNRQIDLRHRRRAEGMKHARQGLPQDNAYDNAECHPEREESLEDPHPGGLRCLQGDTVAHATGFFTGFPSASTTASPSSLMKATRCGFGRMSSTVSDGRHSFTPSGVTTMGRLMRMG